VTRLKLWKQGRQGTDYSVITLWSKWFFDLHIIRIPNGVDVPWHTDCVPNKKHHRINVMFNENSRVRYMDTGRTLRRYFFGMVVYFRPDLRMHMVKKHGPILSKNYKSTYILSLGWTRSK
jgi:hypothetical protein